MRHWHGPALAVAVEAKVNEDNVIHAREREGRSEDPDSPLSAIEKLRRVLRRAKGTYNYRDLALAPARAVAAEAPGDPQPATPGEDEGDAPAAASAGASGSAAQEPSRFNIEVDDEMLLLEESTETVCMLAFTRKAITIVEGRLTPEKKGQFYEGKREALEVFNRNDSWEPINEANVDSAAFCPLRFLLKWKMKDGQKVANARVLYQGIEHRDAAEGQLDKEAPTLSRLDRHTVMLWASLRKDRLFTVDVKSAFLQSDDASVHGLKLHASPTEEMREMLSHQTGMQPGQLLKMIKPGFGDPRSPKLWHRRSDEVTKEIGLRNHKLEDCLLLQVGSYTDASWASRHGGSSQGGYAIFIGLAEELNAGTPTPFVALEWASKKIQRLCRSSLSAEAAAAALGADSLTWVKVYLAWSSRPGLELEKAMVCLGETPFITDAKCLYDASRSATAGATWKRVNTPQQMADGLTKLSAPQLMADVLRRGEHALRYDPDFVAGTKLSKRAMQQREKELNGAGQALHDTLEMTPVTKANEKAKAKGKRHFGASGAKLAAALAASEGGSAVGQVVQYAPSGVELFNPPTPADWNDLIMKMMVFCFVMGLVVALYCGFRAGVWWTRWTKQLEHDTKIEKTREPETEPIPVKVKTTATGTAPRPTKQKKVRRVLVQSQSRDNLDLSTPRFQQLPEYAH
ncbi:unnamed protein product, partial [Prorocentrum cordatum]